MTERKYGQFSIIPARALDDIRFDKNERYLRALMVLGTYADRDGWCYPSLKTVGERLRVSRSTMSATFHDLADWGYVKIIEQSNKEQGQTSNRYRIIHDAELPIKFDRANVEAPVQNASVDSEAPIQKPNTNVEAPVQKQSVDSDTNVPVERPTNERPSSTGNADPKIEIPQSQSPVKAQPAIEDDAPIPLDPKFGRVCKKYQDEIGLLTPTMSETLSDALNDYPEEWICDAIGEATRANVRKWKYAAAILARWKTDGRGDKRAQPTAPYQNRGKVGKAQEIKNAFELYERMTGNGE